MKYVIANWKMQLTTKQATQLSSQLAKKIKTNNKVVICPSFVHLRPVKDNLTGSGIALGAQNCSWAEHAPLTGEVSAESLYDVGCRYIILGHSERRYSIGETDQQIHRKVRTAIDEKLTPIVLVGETEAQHNKKQTKQVLRRQITAALRDLPSVKKVIIGYEPVWCISTNKSKNMITAAEAQATGQWIRDFIKKTWGKKMTVVYGGSVSPKNIKWLKQLDAYDGVLVGSASLNLKSLLKITNQY